MSNSVSSTRKVIIFITVGLAALAVLFSPFLFNKRTAELISKGKVVGIAKRPFGGLWGDVDVYVGESKAFNLWGGDIFHGPILIVPSVDGERFLCVFDYDVEIFAFVVDLNSSATNTSTKKAWPSSDSNRAAFTSWATNTVVLTTGVVRLPSHDDLREASSNLVSMTSTEFKRVSFPRSDFGIYRHYASKELVLFNLRTNREF